MKRGTPMHPKLLALQERLGITRPHAAGILELLWHWTAQYAKAGDVGRFTNASIAQGIGWTDDPDKLVGALLATRWLDSDPLCRLCIHDWYDHADDAVHMACARETLLMRVQHAVDTQSMRVEYTWQIPKLSRFRDKERAQLQARYEDASTHSQHAFNTHSTRIENALPSPPLPSPPLPMPSPLIPDEALETRIINGQTVIAPADTFAPVSNQADAEHRADLWFQSQSPGQRVPKWKRTRFGKLIVAAGWTRTMDLVNECAASTEPEIAACDLWDREQKQNLKPKTKSMKELLAEDAAAEAAEVAAREQSCR